MLKLCLLGNREDQMIRTHTLANGVKIACEERPGAKKVFMTIALKSGSAQESAAESGLTSLTREACFGGSATHPDRDMVAEAVESRGAYFDSDTDREETTFVAEARSQDAEEIFALLADVIRNPVFDPADIRMTQARLQTIVEKSKENPGAVAADKLFEAAFPGQGPANPPAGDPQLIGSFTPAQIKRKHAEMLAQPENIVVSFAGDIDFATAVQLADEAFATLTSRPAAKPAPAVFKGGDIRIANANEQMNLFFGFEAPRLTDRNRYKLILLQELLAGGMSAPLFQEIREKRSLVYSVGARYEAMEDTGFFAIMAGTGKGNAGELIKVSLDVLGDIIKTGFTGQQLATARERVLRKLEGALETASASANRNAAQLMNFGRIVPTQELADGLADVTSDDIRRACAAMLESGKYALAGVGPQDTMPSEQDIKAMMRKQVDGIVIPLPAPASLSKAFARATRSQPQSAPATVFSSTTLANGMMVVTAEQPGSLACGAWVDAGSDHETEALNGATHMNEHMMFRGTPSYPPGSIPRIVENELGGGLNAFTSKDRTAYYLYNLVPANLAKGVNIYGEMVTRANIDAQEYGVPVTDKDGNPGSTGERGVVLEEIKMYDDKVGSRQGDLLYATAYPNQPHGRPILGTRDSLLGISAADLAAYRDAYYAPNHIVSVAAGPVPHTDFVAATEKEFGGLKPVSTPPLPKPNYVGGTASIEMKEARMVSLTLMAEGLADTHEDSAACDAFAQMLGGGESSPLYREIVNRKALAPGIGCGHRSSRNAGEFLVMSAVPASGVKPLIAAIYQEMHKLVENPSQADLDKIKAGMEMQILKTAETSLGLCRFLGNTALTFGRLVTPQEALADIQKVTLDDIRRVGKKILASNPTLAMVAPVGTDPRLLPKHDEVVAMRDAKGGGPKLQLQLTPGP